MNYKHYWNSQNLTIEPLQSKASTTNPWVYIKDIYFAYSFLSNHMFTLFAVFLLRAGIDLADFSFIRWIFAPINHNQCYQCCLRAPIPKTCYSEEQLLYSQTCRWYSYYSDIHSSFSVNIICWMWQFWQVQKLCVMATLFNCIGKPWFYGVCNMQCKWIRTFVSINWYSIMRVLHTIHVK